MKEVVVDASICAKWVIEEDHSDQAVTLLACDTLVAPDHWQAEAVNVLWSKVFKGELAAPDARERMTVLLQAPVIGVPIADLMPSAFTIAVANKVTIYDALYVALAERRGVALVTADMRLVRLVSENAALAKHVVWVGDLAGG